MNELLGKCNEIVFATLLLGTLTLGSCLDLDSRNSWWHVLPGKCNIFFCCSVDQNLLFANIPWYAFNITAYTGYPTNTQQVQLYYAINTKVKPVLKSLDQNQYWWNSEVEILKANYGVCDSSKKHTQDSILSEFCLFLEELQTP